MRRLLALLVLLLAAAGCGSSTVSRPSGVAERWLQGVEETGRPSVADEGREKAEQYGSMRAADALLRDATFEADESLFKDLEVGAAHVSGDRARVPVRVTRRLDGGETDELYLTAVLERDRQGDWQVTTLDESRDGELVPSAGGDRPASATARHWLAAVAIGAVAAVASALLIESQPAVRQQGVPGYVPAAPQRP